MIIQAIVVAVIAAAPAAASQSLYRALSQVGAREYEKPWLAKFPQLSRNDDTLTIKIGTSAVAFQDNPANGEGLTKHSAVESFTLNEGRRDFLIYTSYWEGFSFTLVNGKTGQQARVSAEPQISPDLRRYLVASCDLEADYNPNEFIILNSKGFFPEYKLRFKRGEIACPDSASWISPDKIYLIKKSIKRVKAGEFGPEEVQTNIEPFILELKDGTWELRAVGASNLPLEPTAAPKESK